MIDMCCNISRLYSVGTNSGILTLFRSTFAFCDQVRKCVSPSWRVADRAPNVQSFDSTEDTP